MFDMDRDQPCRARAALGRPRWPRTTPPSNCPSCTGSASSPPRCTARMQAVRLICGPNVLRLEHAAATVLGIEDMDKAQQTSDWSQQHLTLDADRTTPPPTPSSHGTCATDAAAAGREGTGLRDPDVGDPRRRPHGGARLPVGRGGARQTDVRPDRREAQGRSRLPRRLRGIRAQRSCRARRAVNARPEGGVC